MRPETAKTVGLVLKKFIREAEITQLEALLRQPLRGGWPS
jgi:hypothetical protein